MSAGRAEVGLTGAQDGPVRLRPALTADVEAMVRIERATFPDPWNGDAFRSAMHAPAARVTVAERAGAVIGYAVVLHAADESELANLAVAEEARGRGIGRTLLGAALSAAASGGAATMFLEVRESNASARALYESAGFTVVGRRRGYYRRPDEDALLMRRLVTPVGAAAP